MALLRAKFENEYTYFTKDIGTNTSTLTVSFFTLLIFSVTRNDRKMPLCSGSFTIKETFRQSRDAGSLFGFEKYVSNLRQAARTPPIVSSCVKLNAWYR